VVQSVTGGEARRGGSPKARGQRTTTDSVATQKQTAAESDARVRAARALTATVGETRGVEKGHDLHNTMELIR